MQKHDLKILCVIPARLESTRLPRKLLQLIEQQPMIVWTLKSVLNCSFFSKVIVATDSKEIFDVVQKSGGEALLTPEHLPTGTDRAAYVANLFPDYNIVVNVQGDEPFIPREALAALIQPFYGENPPIMATLARNLNSDNEYHEPHSVKVILNKKNEAIYFSRAPIPFFRQKIESVPVYRHIGLYAFQRDFLLKYPAMEQTPLEKTESLEQLRVLENGLSIRVSLTTYQSLDVNCLEDLEKAREFAKKIK